MIDNNEQFEQLLEELLDEIAGYPNGLLQPKTKESAKKAHQSLDSMKQTLENLRIYVKYLLFDLDATRRESRFLKKLLEDKGR